MNKSKTVLLIFFISLNAIFAQDTNDVEINIENLSKKWVVSGIINPDRTEEELKETFSLIEATTLQLNSDLTCIFDFILELPGTWSLEEDQIIRVRNRKGDTNWTIHNLKKNELTMSRNDAKQKLVFKPEN